VTKGGDATDDEMCIGFFLYYPVQPNVKCMTTNVALANTADPHVCQIPGQATVDDSLCTAPPTDVALASIGFGSLSSWLQVHIVCMVLSMGLLIPIGVLIPMAFRGSENDAWFRYHWILQSTGVLILLVGVSIALANVSLHMTNLHHKLGVAIFALSLLQPLNALIRPHKASSSAADGDANNDKPSTKRTIWEVVHKGLGRGIVLASFVNIFLGIRLLKQWYSASGGLSNGLIGFQAFVIVALVLVGAYKILIQKKKTTSPSGEAGRKKKQHESSLGEAA